ncbi:MAG: hypothetical protein COU65_03090 [Candidatus Pacebacteria bacterium CG10_big_fil_rev_8_21_14_0_10_42_12]|nr:MAG: hypothetical protein COU65_03090 [Candidatus Pacebacteria bacterium CG10_big_fil_rev_8_21_14_0_10_42_12]
MKNKLRRNNWLIAVVLLVLAPFSLAQLGRIEFAFGGAYVFEIGIFLLVTLNAQKLILSLARRFKNSKSSSKLMLGWLILLTLAGCLNSESIVPFLYVSRYFFYGLFAYLLATQMPKLQQKKLPSLILITGIFMTFLGLLQYVFLPDTRFLRSLGWDDHYYRVIGTLLDPNYFGMLIILTVSLTFSLQKKLIQKALWFIVSFLLSMLALTYSRSSYLAGIVFLSLVTFVSKSKRLASMIVSALAVSALVFVVAPKPGGEGMDLLRTSTIESRISHEKEVVADANILQVLAGKGMFASDSPKNSSSDLPNHAKQPNSIFTLVYSSSGILGLLIATFFIIKFLARLYKKDKYITLGLVALIVHASFNNSVLEPILALFWLLLVAVVEIKARNEY